MKALINLKNVILLTGLIILSLFVAVPAVSVNAAQDGLTGAACDAAVAIGGECVTKEESAASVGNIFQRITNVLLFLVGAISVIMVIIGGIRFVVSSGDAQAAANARNTVIYAVIGVIVAIGAYGIINFTINAIEGDLPTSNESSIPPDCSGTLC